MEKLLTKNDLLQKLRSYAYTPDDDVIRIKERVKEKLLKCPERRSQGMPNGRILQ